MSTSATESHSAEAATNSALRLSHPTTIPPPLDEALEGLLWTPRPREQHVLSAQGKNKRGESLGCLRERFAPPITFFNGCRLGLLCVCINKKRGRLGHNLCLSKTYTEDSGLGVRVRNVGKESQLARGDPGWVHPFSDSMTGPPTYPLVGFSHAGGGHSFARQAMPPPFWLWGLRLFPFPTFITSFMPQSCSGECRGHILSSVKPLTRSHMTS